MKPVLRGPRTTLRPATPADSGRVADLLRHPDVRRYLCDDRVLSDSQIAELLATAATLDGLGLGFWTGWTPAEGFIALLGLTRVNVDLTHGTAVAGLIEPSVALAPALWGRGLAAEMLGLLLAHARDGAGLTRVAGLADAPNAASLRMLARAGFRPVGRAQGAVYPAVLHELSLAPG